jgi:hypothetical protein
MGDDWWNTKRQEVYASTDYHCSACGVHKKDAKKHKWLEAHEFWDINYGNGVCTIKSIEPLCHYCHNFIHSGRLQMIMGNDKTKSEVIEILEHGFKVLSENNLKCFPGTMSLAESLDCDTYDAYSLPACNIGWDEWVLEWEGKQYKSKFTSFEDWKKSYAHNR